MAATVQAPLPAPLWFPAHFKKVVYEISGIMSSSIKYEVYKTLSVSYPAPIIHLKLPVLTLVCTPNFRY